MEPGGSHGLQNRSRPDYVGLGGFDSHALPPLIRRLAALMPTLSRSITMSLLALAPLAGSLGAQRTDSTRAAPPAPLAGASADSLRAPLGPRRAFFYSFLAPGYSQTVLGRNKAAAAFLLVEAISIAMIRESAADVHEARRTVNDSVIVSYVDAQGTLNPTKLAPRFTDADVHTRMAHVEDWIALLVANHLFAGADAFVAANLWDIHIRLGLREVPSGVRPGALATTLVASLPWP